ncbi:MAG: FtsK/SpoIIIE domain-containing protein [Nocardioidaceae bacterium]
MAIATSQRGPAGAPLPLRTPAGELPAVARAAPMVVCVLSSLTAIAASLGYLIFGGSTLAVFIAGLLGLVLTVVGASAAYRHDRRRKVLDKATEAVTPVLGFRHPSRTTVRARHWSGGSPRVIRLRYAHGLADRDPNWRSELYEVFAEMLGANYTVWRNNRLKHRIVLVRDDEIQESEPVPVVQQRAEDLVGRLLPGSVISTVRFEGGDLVAVELDTPADPKLATSGYQNRIERTWSTMMPGRWRASFDLEADTIVLGVRPTFPTNVWLPVLQVDESRDLLSSYDDVELPYAVDEDGTPLVWYPARQPNLMLVGVPGTGKTVAVHSLVVQIARFGWAVWVVDGKSVEFLGFRDWPNVQIVATSIEEQVATIHRAWEVMEHRYQLITSGRAMESDFEPLLLVLDEWADFRGNLTDWYAAVKVKGDPPKPAVLGKVASIARKGRTSRVHLVFATQRPDAEYFGGDMRDNFPARISMSRLTPQGAMMMWESPSVGTSVPRGCRGRCTTVDRHGRPVEAQTYYTPDPRKTAEGTFEAGLLDQLRPTIARHDRLVMVPSTGEVVDEETGECAVPTYTEYAGAAWARTADRPDLDPLAQRVMDQADGRELSSPMSIFGLSTAGSPVEPVPVSTLASALPASAVDSAFDSPDDACDPFDGYGDAEDLMPDQVTVGDLVLVDETTGLWAVATGDAEISVVDEETVCIEWRSDTDEDGTLELGEDQFVMARRPCEIAPQEK